MLASRARVGNVSERCRQSCRRAGQVCGQRPVTYRTAFFALQSRSACPRGHLCVVRSVIDHPPLRFAAMVVVNDLWRGVGGAGRGGLILCFWDEELRSGVPGETEMELIDDLLGGFSG